jgi:hypothetical protein
MHLFPIAARPLPDLTVATQGRWPSLMHHPVHLPRPSSSRAFGPLRVVPHLGPEIPNLQDGFSPAMTIR